MRMASRPAFTIRCPCTCNRPMPTWVIGSDDFPESERAANEVLSLPMFPELTHTQIEQVTAAVKQESYAA